MEFEIDYDNLIVFEEGKQEYRLSGDMAFLKLRELKEDDEGIFITGWIGNNLVFIANPGGLIEDNLDEVFERFRLIWVKTI